MMNAVQANNQVEMPEVSLTEKVSSG